MSIKAHDVIATTVVIETAETLQPGDRFTPTSAAQRDRLIAAGCIREPASAAKRPVRQRTDKDTPPAPDGADTDNNEES